MTTANTPRRHAIACAPSLTISWGGIEPVKGKVFYDTNHIVSFEANESQGEPSISGTVAADETLAVNKEITLQNLALHTVYYYIVEAIDASGNVSVTNEKTFTTQ